MMVRVFLASPLWCAVFAHSLLIAAPETPLAGTSDRESASRGALGALSAPRMRPVSAEARHHALADNNTGVVPRPNNTGSTTATAATSRDTDVPTTAEDVPSALQIRTARNALKAPASSRANETPSAALTALSKRTAANTTVQTETMTTGEDEGEGGSSGLHLEKDAPTRRRRVVAPVTFHQVFNNPISDAPMFCKIVVILVSIIAVITVTFITIIYCNQDEKEVDVVQYAVPETLFGATLSTYFISTHKLEQEGFKTSTLCDILSSVCMQSLRYALLWALIGVAERQLFDFDDDVDERDSIFEKFRPPELWQAQNWTENDGTFWERMSLSWFCHDVIYGKANHVNQIDMHYFVTGFVFLFLWFAYMLMHFRETLQNLDLVWSLPNMSGADRVVATDQKASDGIIDTYDIKGIPVRDKIFLIVVVILPRLCLDALILYIGVQFTFNNDADDHLQEILLRTMELAFMMETDQILFGSFVSDKKKDQLRNMTLPREEKRGLSLVFYRYSEMLLFLVLLAACIIMGIGRYDTLTSRLTTRQEGIIEGCCNFMQYVRGRGVKETLAEGNPCTEFRATYENN